VRNTAAALLSMMVAVASSLCTLDGLARAQTSSFVTQVAEITDPENSFDDQFGYSVAMSGNTLVVGAPQFAGGTGLAYVFLNSRGTWREAARLTSGSNQTILLGISVAVGGDVIAVGTPDMANENSNGEVCVFVKPPGGWRGDLTPTAVLTLPAVADNLLGTSVAVSADGTTVAAGAPSFLAASGVYVFVKPQGGWTNMTEATATLSPSSGFETGAKVAMSGNTIVAGEAATGNFQSAYVFVEPPGGWVSTTQPTATLNGSDETGQDDFGASLSISGSTIVVDSGHGTGTVYVFVEPEAGWTDMTQTAELTLKAKGDPGLGFATAITGDVVLATAPGDFIGQVAQGAVFWYVKPATGWANTSLPNGSVIASDGGADEGFGGSLAVSGATFVVGAQYKGGNDQGAVYIFAAT
jgi:FG-GAP repeat